MLEIEIKSPCQDLDLVEKELIAKKAALMGECRQVDIYLAHPCRDFALTDEALRLRYEKGGWTLYYKGPRLDKETKSREEIASPVSEVESLKLILARLGFQEVGKVEKRRRIYSYEGAEVSLDRVEGLGRFVEVEVTGEELEKGRSKVLRIMKELGLEKSERRSYLELVMEKEKG